MNLTIGVMVALALSAQPAAQPRRVAVLDFGASWGVECVARAKLTKTEREQCEILRLFADQARGGALAVLRPPAFVVMTRENTAQILKDMGGQCSEGECEVETARLLGASVVVSGEVSLLEGTYMVSLKVHDVATAALLGTGHTRGKSKLEAFDNVRAETEKMLRGSVGFDGVGGSAPQVEAKAAPPTSRPPPAPLAAAEVEEKVAAAAPAAEMPPEPSWGGRRWYAEFSPGMRWLASKLKGSADRAELPAYNSGSVAVAPALRLGLRTSRYVAFEASASFLFANAVAERYFYTCPELASSCRFELGATYHPWLDVGLTGVVTPAGSPYIGVTLGVGLIVADGAARGATISYTQTEKRTSGTSPYLALGLRSEIPFRSNWALVATGGVVLVKSSLSAESGESAITAVVNDAAGLPVYPWVRSSLDASWLTSVDAGLGIRRYF